jgi:hypothetical protein
MFKSRMRAGLVVLALAAASALAFVSSAGAVSVTNACKNSVTPNASQIGGDIAGTAPATVTPAGAVPLTGLHQQVVVPGSIFVAGYNLGLLTVGKNTIPSNLRTVIEGTNTVQGIQTAGPANFSVTTTITDPDATPGTGDESATNAPGTASYPDMTWTAGPSGLIEFREDTVTPLGKDVGGVIVNATVGGVIHVQFRCSPGTVTGPDPGVISFLDPAPTFASAQIQPAAGGGAAATNPRCATLRKKLKKAKKAHNKTKVKKIRRQLRKLGC